MALSLQDVAAEITKALDLRPPFMVWAVSDWNDTIMVGTADLSFSITRKTIDDNLHIQRAWAGYAALQIALKFWPELPS